MYTQFYSMYCIEHIDWAFHFTIHAHNFAKSIAWNMLTKHTISQSMYTILLCILHSTCWLKVPIHNTCTQLYIACCIEYFVWADRFTVHMLNLTTYIALNMPFEVAILDICTQFHNIHCIEHAVKVHYLTGYMYSM